MGHLASPENAGVRDRTPKAATINASGSAAPEIGPCHARRVRKFFPRRRACHRGVTEEHRLATNDRTHGLRPVRGDQSERCRGIEIDVQCREPGPVRLLCRRTVPSGGDPPTVTLALIPPKSRVFRLRRDRKLHLFHRTPLPSFGNWKSIKHRLDGSLISGKIVAECGWVSQSWSLRSRLPWNSFWWRRVPIDFSVLLYWGVHCPRLPRPVLKKFPEVCQSNLQESSGRRQSQFI